MDPFLCVDTLLFQHHLLQRLSLFHSIAIDLLSKISDYVQVGLFLDLLFYFIDLIVCSFSSSNVLIIVALQYTNAFKNVSYSSQTTIFTNLVPYYNSFIKIYAYNTLTTGVK